VPQQRHQPAVTIRSVEATLHRVPVEVPLLAGSREVAVVIVRVESDAGVVGYGAAGTMLQGSVVEFINRELGPFVTGRDPLPSEQLWHAVQQRFNARALSGVVSCGLSGFDLAVWDLRGKMLDQPVWRLLGGFSADVAAYITFGLPEYDPEQLEEAARLAVSRGFDRLKMVVGRGRGAADDIERVSRVRRAIGADVALMIDANEGFDLVEAAHLARLAEPLALAWFEEPIAGNDVALLAELRRKTSIPIAAGQFEGHRFRLRDLIVGGAIDVLQTNVLFVGGLTEGLKVAHLAEAWRLPVANGGGWAEHNAPLLAAVANGHGVEVHAWQWMLARTLYTAPPEVAGGRMTLSPAPGLGLEPDQAVLRATRVRGDPPC
jgi:L-rhamnonate dehydratase